MPAAFPHTSSFPGDEPLRAEPLQLLLLMAVQKQLPHAGSLQLGHRSYNIWDCVTSLQGFCGSFILHFFDEMGSGGWRDPCMICALKDAEEGQRRFDAKTKQKSRIAIRKVMFIPLVFLVQHLKK